MRIPKKLEHDTIGESLFEFRFQPNNNSAAEIILGILYEQLRNEFPKIEQTPINQMPRTIIDVDPNLRYQALHRLLGTNFLISVGSRSISVHAIRPYSGWLKYKPQIIRVFNLLKQTGLVQTTERFSLKYLNLLTPDLLPKALGALNFRLELADFLYRPEAVMVRTEIVRDEFVNIVQILTGATMHFGQTGPNLNGILVDVETVFQGDTSNIMQMLEQKLDRAHEIEKEVYFSLLTPEAIRSLGPEY